MNVVSTITIPKMRVRKITDFWDEGYVVDVRDNGGRWRKKTQVYAHSTSAYAKMGRMLAELIQESEEEQN